REHWLALKEQRLAHIAAELAAELADGEACAVCGSTDHPAPARKIPGHVDRQAEETALAGYRRADDERAEVERALAGVRESLAAATAAAGDAATDELASAVEELNAAHARARGLAAGLHTARET
ncbi:SMC family ATPase, partial [Streptomyces sp. T-3]|nr:SMC family ATPase [Streptomyces sp. T-3]